MDENTAAERVSRREILKRGTAVAVGASLSGGFAKAAFARSDAAARVHVASSSKDLNVWGFQPAGNGYPEAWAAAGKRWEAAHPGGKYHYTDFSSSDYSPKVLTSFLGGAPPDVLEVETDGTYWAWVKANGLMKLDSFLPKLPKFYPSTLNELRVPSGGNGLYGIPLDVNTLTIAYNKDIFAKLGLKIPQTYDELLALAAPIRAGGYQPIACPLSIFSGDVWFAMLAYTDPTGKALSQAQAGKIKWTDPRFLQAAVQTQRAYTEKLFADGSESIAFGAAQTLFASGKAAMFYPAGNFDTTTLTSLAGGKFAYDLFAFPPLKSGQKARATGGVAIAWAVPAKAKNIQGALDYIKLTCDAKGYANLIQRDFIPAAKANTAANHSAIYKKLVSFQATAALPRAIFIPKVSTAMESATLSLLTGHSQPADVVAAIEKAA